MNKAPRNTSTGGAPAGLAPTRQLPLTSLVTLLCVVSGSLDAISLLGLGEAFASVMTGNIVFLGVAAGTGSSTLAFFSGTAIAGYCGGVMVGSVLAARWSSAEEARIWPAKVTRVMSLQFAVLVVMALAWFALDGGSTGFELSLLAAAGAAMGLQSAAVRGIGVAVSSTYMTGALTTLLEAVVTRRRFTATEKSAVGGLLSLALGALIGSAAITLVPRAPLLVPLAALGAVIALRVAYARRETGA